MSSGLHPKTSKCPFLPRLTVSLLLHGVSLIMIWEVTGKDSSLHSLGVSEKRKTELAVADHSGLAQDFYLPSLTSHLHPLCALGTGGNPHLPLPIPCPGDKGIPGGTEQDVGLCCGGSLGDSGDWES